MENDYLFDAPTPWAVLDQGDKSLLIDANGELVDLATMTRDDLLKLSVAMNAHASLVEVLEQAADYIKSNCRRPEYMSAIIKKVLHECEEVNTHTFIDPANLDEDEIDPAEQAAAMGYRRVSNKYRLVARIDRPDWLDLLARGTRRAKADFYEPGELRPSGHWCDYYRRCLSKDTLTLPDAQFHKVPSSSYDRIGYVAKKFK